MRLIELKKIISILLFENVNRARRVTKKNVIISLLDKKGIMRNYFLIWNRLNDTFII